MKTLALSACCLLVLTVTVSSTRAADAPITTRAQAVEAMTQLGNHMDAQTATFNRYAASAQKLSTLYASLDAKAAALVQAAGRCANGCSGDAASQLQAATKGMKETQMSFNLQY